MRRAIRTIATIAAAGTLAAVGAVAASGTASAATSCYGGAVNLQWETVYQSTTGPYTTTSRCVDINLRSTTAYGVQACVIFLKNNPNENCNYITHVGSSWKTIATDVLDGTKFKVWVEAEGNDPGPFSYAKLAF